MSRESHIEHHRNYCVHYNPRGTGCGCDAGMDRDKIQCVQVPHRNGGTINWGPCIGGHQLDDPSAHCAKWERRSLEEAEKHADDIEKLMDRMAKAGPVISAWRSKLPRGKAEVIECPCCQGRLHLSQASSNGHVRAQCETVDCINFVE